MKEFAEKLIGRLEELKCKYKNLCDACDIDSELQYDLGRYYGVFETISIVNQLAEEYNNGWIPCEKELPETNESVLCWAKSTARGGDVCFVGSYHKGFWFLQSSANTHSFPGQYKIVAWQQLPEPYQKGE